MHIVDGVRGETPPWVFDADDECPGAGSAPAGASRPAPSRSEPNAQRRPIATAIAWVVAHFIEGFEAYGNAIYPSFVDHGGLIDDPRQNRDSELRGPAEIWHLSGAPWPNTSDPQMVENPGQSTEPRTASPGWSATIAYLVIRVWSRVSRARRTRLTVTRLEALDDHMLKDIGVHRCQIESIARHRDRNEW
jgi:uncharacterized protein YjiS (DUF1127 family)